jgi:hypothetical protein
MTAISSISTVIGKTSSFNCNRWGSRVGDGVGEVNGVFGVGVCGSSDGGGVDDGESVDSATVIEES